MFKRAFNNTTARVRYGTLFPSRRKRSHHFECRRLSRAVVKLNKFSGTVTNLAREQFFPDTSFAEQGWETSMNLDIATRFIRATQKVEAGVWFLCSFSCLMMLGYLDIVGRILESN